MDYLYKVNKSNALTGIPKNVQTVYYPTIIELQSLEYELNNMLKEYKNTYAEYVSKVKLLSNNQWFIEQNMTVANPENTIIADSLNTNINMEECIQNCLKDNKCAFILFSDSGNGVCAANQCLKYTTDAVDLIKNTKSNIQKNLACNTNNGPAQTNYVYKGWKKPSWTLIEEEKAFSNEVKSYPLGSLDNIQACKNASMNDRNGPYQYIEFYHTNESIHTKTE